MFEPGDGDRTDASVTDDFNARRERPVRAKLRRIEIMFKKLMAIALVTLMLHVTYSQTALAHGTPEKEARFAEKVKSGIAKLGTGKDALVKVKLRDGTKLSGYITEADESSFVVVDSKTGAHTTIPYPQVKQVKRNNLSSGAWFAIGVGVIVGVVVLVLVASKGH
jgi:hypothetical protein